MKTREEAEKYAAGIRNKKKKQYALDWIAYCFDGKPQPFVKELSFKAGHAIRYEIGYPDVPNPEEKKS